MLTRRHKFLLTAEVVVISMLFLLAGCQTPAPPPPPITKYVVVTPTPYLLRLCSATAVPPDPAAYVAAKPEEKEKMLHDFGAASQNDLERCNARWPILSQWFVDQTKNYASPPAAASAPK
jgi:hypothetical protein